MRLRGRFCTGSFGHGYERRRWRRWEGVRRRGDGRWMGDMSLVRSWGVHVRLLEARGEGILRG